MKSGLDRNLNAKHTGGHETHRMKYCLLLVFCILVVSPACLATSNSSDSSSKLEGNTEVENLTRVTKKWVELLDAGKLPGMTKEEHGNLSGYHLTESVKRNFLDSKVIDNNMLSDIKDCKDSYLVSVVTTRAY